MKRLIIKADWQDGERDRRGCILTQEHLQNPMVMLILDVALETAPAGMDVIVTEGWRDIRDTPDAHERFHAFDFSLGDLSIVGGKRWADDMGAKLGDDYYVVCHGPNWHVHAQIRKGRG